MAKSYGEKSLACAEAINDDVWKRNATVLIAQSEAKIGDVENLQYAIKNFEKALQLSEKQNDDGASKAIRTALADCKEKLKKLQINSSPREEEKVEPQKAIVRNESPEKKQSIVAETKPAETKSEIKAEKVEEKKGL